MKVTSANISPGPWQFVMQEAFGKPEFTAALSGKDSKLGDLKFAFLMHPAECQANARLIAAAPELLEALIKCKRAVENTNLTPSARLELVRDFATPAIFKAEGAI